MPNTSASSLCGSSFRVKKYPQGDDARLRVDFELLSQWKSKNGTADGFRNIVLLEYADLAAQLDKISPIFLFLIYSSPVYEKTG